MKTSINYICGSVYVEATIQRIAHLHRGRKSIFVFCRYAIKVFDMLMLTKENDEVKFDYDPACSSLDYFTSKTIQA